MGALLVLLFVVRYWRLGEFGLYEDDLTFIPAAVVMRGSALIGQAFDYVVHLYGHGRPLSDTLIRGLSWLGWRIGGLDAIYAIGYLIVGFNAALVFGLANRLHSRGMAFFAGLAFVLFSADTTQAFLTHALGLQPSLTFVLLAFHACLSSRYVLAHALAVVALFTYETTYPVFLAAPFLVHRWDRGMVRPLVSHVGIQAALFVGAVILRTSVQDDRISALSPVGAMATAFRHVAVGAPISLGSYVIRAVQSVQGPVGSWLPAWVLAFMILMTAIRLWGGLPTRDRQPSRGIPQSEAPPAPRRPRKGAKDIGSWVTWAGSIPYLRLAFAGLTMVVLAYPLTFGLRSFALQGRATRVHFAAAPGAAVVWASIGHFLYSGGVGTRWRRVGVFGWLTATSFLPGFGLQVQRDYAQAWENQVAFWTDLIAVVPDASEGVVVLVDPQGLADTGEIGGNTWNLPRVLEQVYEFPAEWAEPPRVFRLLPRWEERIASPGCRMIVDNRTVDAPPSLYGDVDPGRVVLLLTSGRDLARGVTVLRTSACELELRPVGPAVLPTLPHRLLYSLLIDGERR